MANTNFISKESMKGVVADICDFIKRNLTYTKDGAYIKGEYDIDFTVKNTEVSEEYYIVLRPNLDITYKLEGDKYVMQTYYFEVSDEDLDADIDNYIQIFDVTGLDVSFLDENDLLSVCVSCNMSEDELLNIVDDIVINMSYGMWRLLKNIPA